MSSCVILCSLFQSACLCVYNF
uniref:Uncharacterized protein n=1 Tax=Rhizophora mucronata TaxID=61149 RepID=A0A2P2MAE4_RHIMU